MGSISHHITPLVINSLGGGHAHARKLTCIQTSSQCTPGLINVKCKLITYDQVYLNLPVHSRSYYKFQVEIGAVTN